MDKLSLENVIEQRPLSSYTNEAIKNIKLLSFNQRKLANIFGSVVFKVQKYPSDIDLIEIYENCCNIDQVVSLFASRLQIIVQQILQTKNHYFSEFKAGLDKRYEIDLGSFINGDFKPNINLIGQKTLELFNNNLLNSDEVKVIHEVLMSNIYGGEQYDTLNYIFRERMILRWSANEILNGFKELPGNIIMSLTEALKMKTHVKIDMIVLINGFFIEVTNFLLLVDVKSDGSFQFINTLTNYFDVQSVLQRFQKEVRNEIQKLYYSNLYYNPFKVVKRIFSLARILKDEDVLLKILPLYSGNLSLAYKLAGDISTILRMYKIVNYLPIDLIINELQSIKNQLSYVIEISNEDLINLNTMIDSFTIYINKESQEVLLKDINKKLKILINYHTISSLNKIGLNPPPKEYLPIPIKYQQIVRDPDDIPTNPLKKYHYEGSGLVSEIY